MASLFALKLDMGVMGLQMGIALALFAQLIVYLIILIKSDWQMVADQAAARINNETLKLKEIEIEFDDMKVFDNY